MGWAGAGTGRWVIAGLILLAATACGDGGESDGTAQLSTTTEAPTPTTGVTTSTTTESGAPSQRAEDAARDGVLPEVAAAPFAVRVGDVLHITTEEGNWIVSRAPEALAAAAGADGCLGATDGVYGVDFVCPSEYGELLLVDGDGRIVRAYPLPSLPPSWIHVTERAVYAGRIGDGGLPDSSLVRIARTTLDSTVMVFHQNEGPTVALLPGWTLAGSEATAHLPDVVTYGPGRRGTDVTSAIGPVAVDITGIDEPLDPG